MQAVRSDMNPSDVLNLLEPLGRIYPAFRPWYLHKVMPGLQDGSRRVLAAAADDRVLGVAILKKSASELKLCTLWTDPAAPSGTSDCLLEASFDWLGTRRPVFSVPDDILPRMRRLISEMDATSAEELVGVYRPGVVEHLFNGRLL